MIFPEYEVSVSEGEEESIQRQGKTFAYDFEQGDFITQDGRLVALEGAEGLKVWAEKCIRTEAEKFTIYRQDDAAYGVKSVDLMNRRLPLEFICAEIEREITEALLRNEAITGVRDFSFIREGRALQVDFVIESIYGEQEVSKLWQIV